MQISNQTLVVFPPTIVKAICAIKAEVEAVKKSQKNQHGGYMFSSTDDIYAAVARKMGQVGLICLSFETTMEIITAEPRGQDKAPSKWLKAVYSFVLATETETFQHEQLRRTIMVQITGPQTFQAAQSYAEKTFLRMLFKLPTGDVDLDVLPENYEYASIFDKGLVPPIPDCGYNSSLSDEIVAALRKASSCDHTQAVLDGYWEQIHNYKGDDRSSMIKLINEEIDKLEMKLRTTFYRFE